MTRLILAIAVIIVISSSYGTESTISGYRVEWGKASISGAYELHRPASAHGDRDTLIYRGPRRSLDLYQSNAPSFRTRICELGGCSPFSATESRIQGNTDQATPAPTPVKLIAATRSRDEQKLARRNQPKGSRLVGLVEMDIHESVYSCDMLNLKLGLKFEITLPGLRATTVTSHRLIENIDGSWSWYGQDATGQTRLNLSAHDCASRPFAAVKTTNGSYWIRPVADGSLFAVYRQRF